MLSSLSSTLETSGLWGLVAILMLVIVFLAKYIIKLHDQINNVQDTKNTQLLDLLERKIESDVKYEQAFNNLSKLIEVSSISPVKR